MSRCALIVDDSEPNRRLPALILAQIGWTTVEVGSGEAAIQAARTRWFDCVLLDLMLPDIAGTQVCRALRTLPLGPSQRIVAYTALPDEDSALELQFPGFDAVLHKPLSRRSLLEALGDAPDESTVVGF